YRFDKDHNSYFRRARKLRDQPAGAKPAAPAAGTVDEAIRDLDGGDRAAQSAAIKFLGSLGPAAQAAIPAPQKLSGRAPNGDIGSAANQAVGRIIFPVTVYPRAEIEPIEEQAKLRSTATARHDVEAGGLLPLTLRVAGNGLNFVVIEPEHGSKSR